VKERDKYMKREGRLKKCKENKRIEKYGKELYTMDRKEKTGR